MIKLNLLSSAFKRVGKTVVYTSAAAVISPGIMAAENTSKGFGIEEVVVTARKREENLQDTPLSVAAFTANEMKVRQIHSSDQLSQITPNLSFSSQAPSSGSNASSQIFIRGIGQTEFLPSTDPGVGLYIDGVYMARSVGGTLDFADLERIEVLRGPQGTLFGRNTIGGAIDIHTRKPSEEFGGEVEIKVGSDNQLELMADINLPISENLLTKISVGKRDRDGYVKRLVDGDDLGDDNTVGARAAVLWTPSDDVRLFWTADYNKEDENGSPQVFNSIASGNLFALVSSQRAGCPAPGTELADPRCANNQWDAGPYANNGTFPVASELEGWGTQLTVDWDLDWVSIKSITAYRDMEWYASRDADNTPFTILHTQNDDTQEQFSQELQFSGTAMEDRLQWLVGLYYFEEEATDDYYVPITFGDFKTGGDVDNDTQAIFAQATYNFSNALSLTIGLRSSEETKRFTPDQGALTTYVFPIADSEKSGGMYLHPVTGELFPIVAAGAAAAVPAGTPFFPAGEVENDITETTPMINLSYRWNDQIMTYVSYSEGFKSGGFNARNVKPGPEVREFDPEFAETIEVGFKTDLFDGTLRLNGAIFTTDYTDLQFIIREDFSPITFNAGAATIDGFELEWTWVPTSQLHVVGGLGYIDGDYDELSPELIANGGVFLNSAMPHSPDWSGNLGVAYSIELGDMGSLTPRVDWSYRSKVYFNAENTEEIAQGSYSVVNAALTWYSADEAWQVIAAVNNLTDETYRVAGNSSLTASAAYAESTYAREREYSLSVKFNY
ncbi:MAG: TonB-dependent receptor [Pseudomonadales bacterium]|nr:TonB-dependent receptor [Pseudomonadales bacterium]MCP5214156.1 TonB-dependent receptor [Pseudomonadales bacterium]